MNLLVKILLIAPFAILIIYIVGFFILSRLFIPNLGFKKSPLPKKIPKEILKKIKKLKARSKNKKHYLRNVYNYLTKKYQGKRLTVLKKPKQLFETDLKKIWKRKGFIPCHTFTNLIRLFLVKSRLFKEKDVEVRHTFLWFNIHQYLKVKIKKRWHKVDGWAKAIGVKFGDYARMFK